MTKTARTASNDKFILQHQLTQSQKIYDKITTKAQDLVKIGRQIEAEFGLPIVNKRVTVTPIALIAAASGDADYVKYAKTLDRAAHAVGIDFIGGFSALTQKGYQSGDRVLINSLPQALAETELVCASVNVGSTRSGINMDAVEGNPFMAGGFHGVSEPDVVINAGVSGPGVVKAALEKSHFSLRLLLYSQMLERKRGK